MLDRELTRIREPFEIMSDPSQNSDRMVAKLEENSAAADVAVEAIEAAKNACR